MHLYLNACICEFIGKLNIYISCSVPMTDMCDLNFHPLDTYHNLDSFSDNMPHCVTTICHNLLMNYGIMQFY